MSFQDELTAVLPTVDINGDTFEFYPRAGIRAYIDVLYLPFARHAHMPYDLDWWWPEDSDGLCMGTRAAHADDPTLPYSTTTLRRITFVQRIAPDLLSVPIHFGAMARTTTPLKAYWDCGIRRIRVEYKPDVYAAIALRVGHVPSRLVPIPSDDPWPARYIPYYMDLSQRPDVDDPIEWLRRDNV